MKLDSRDSHSKEAQPVFLATFCWNHEQKISRQKFHDIVGSLSAI